MELGNLMVFVGAAVMLALSPGPDILSVISRSATQGVRVGLVATLGFAAGLPVHTTVVAALVTGAITMSPAAFLWVRWLGAGYLIYLAARNVLSRRAFVMEASGTRAGLWNVFGQSALMNVLNPKVTLFFLALLPGFVVKDAARTAMPAWLQVVVLGVVFAMCTIVVFGSCAMLAGGITGWLRKKPKAPQVMKWCTSGLFVVIAVWIAWPAKN